jgi:3D (Asp-Asp-Asp) domain-containing protein
MSLNLKVEQNGNDITNAIGSMTWSGSAYSGARTFEFTTLNPAGDTRFKMPTIKTGDLICLYNGSSKLFHGKVTKRERKGEAGTVSYTAQDFMLYLIRSKGTYKFKKKKPEQITQLICKDLKIKTKSIAKTGMKISKILFTDKEYYNMILAAYTKAYKKTGTSYQPIFEGDKLSVIKKGAMLDLVLNQNEGITESSYEETTDSMVNKVVIYNSKNKKIGTVSNKNWVKTYGTFQDSLSVEKGNGKKEAKNTLAGLEKTASLSAIGDIRCVSGYGIRINDTDSGLTGTFWIENDTHTFENGVHTMSLELAFKNVMETEEGDDESGSSSSGSTKSSGILNGKKVKALYTAYYPANNKMEGGYYDCKGKKLDPSKYTCAAPTSIAYGKQIQVLGTKTSRDKKVHKVNDRGGAIKIVNGVYHFDLLMKTRAQCNKFGRRSGYAIIGNGTGFKQVTDSGSSKADKVIKKAKTYIGKVKYVYGASSPQSGKSDCSGFTSYVFKKAAGKSVGRTALAQSQKGKKVSKGSLKKGDLVIFQGTYKSGASHVGIYIGSGKFIHCSSSEGVKVSNLSNTYYAQHWMQGRRVL